MNQFFFHRADFSNPVARQFNSHPLDTAGKIDTGGSQENVLRERVNSGRGFKESG
jgi:hypothetical protein